MEGSYSRFSTWHHAQPPFLPLSMCTSRIFFWRTILRPPQALQRSLWLMRRPWPWQLWHTLDTCWTIPIPSWWRRTCMPVPWHDMHISTAPLRPPRPGQRAERRTMVRRRSAFTALLRPLQINGVPALMTRCDTLYQYCYSQDKT